MYCILGDRSSPRWHSTLGGTHHTMEDVAVAGVIPNMQRVRRSTRTDPDHALLGDADIDEAAGRQPAPRGQRAAGLATLTAAAVR